MSARKQIEVISQTKKILDEAMESLIDDLVPKGLDAVYAERSRQAMRDYAEVQSRILTDYETTSEREQREMVAFWASKASPPSSPSPSKPEEVVCE